MKTLRNLIIICSLIIFTAACNSASENAKTETFKVWGNCGMCKKTIEGSIVTHGIVQANWNEDTKLIEVVYDSTKTNVDELKQSIAGVGYDTEEYSGNDAAYAKLPGCCQYERRSQAPKP